MIILPIFQISSLDFAGDDLEGEDGAVDIKDVEFRMKNDDRKMRSLLQSSKAMTYKDLNLLKVILTSGLYPQMAIADEYNHAKSGAEQLYHTKVRTIFTK